MKYVVLIILSVLGLLAGFMEASRERCMSLSAEVCERHGLIFVRAYEDALEDPANECFRKFGLEREKDVAIPGKRVNRSTPFVLDNAGQNFCPIPPFADEH